MSALLFLAIAVVLTVIGVSVLWLLNRKPTSVDSSISAFQKEMQALSPEARSRAAREQRDRAGGR